MIDFKTVITDGFISQHIINDMADMGWNYLTTVPATTINMYAVKTDMVTIFKKYKEEGEK